MTEFEVEKKYRVDEADSISITQLLKGMVLKEASHRQLDVVYLYGMDSFKEFKKGDPVIRIRQKDKSTILTLKKQLNNESSYEIESGISDVDSIDKILKGAGFREVVRVEKNRVVYDFDGAEVCVDDVHGLGKFIEIEILCSIDKQEDAKKRIDSIAKSLGLSDDMVEPRKYDALIKEMKSS